MRYPAREWDILLIGGASGSGKTCLSRELTRFYGIDLLRVDDFQVLLEALTTPDSFPSIHYWNTHPNWRSEGVAAAVERLLAVGRALTPGLTAVINDHLEENIPMVLEGDFILPGFAASFTHPKVKSVFIYEPSRAQILQNYMEREGKLQEFRADVSHVYGDCLANSCLKHGVPIVEARPWNGLIERVIHCIE